MRRVPDRYRHFRPSIQPEKPAKGQTRERGLIWKSPPRPIRLALILPRGHIGWSTTAWHSANTSAREQDVQWNAKDSGPLEKEIPENERFSSGALFRDLEADRVLLPNVFESLPPCTESIRTPHTTQRQQNAINGTHMLQRLCHRPSSVIEYNAGGDVATGWLGRNPWIQSSPHRNASVLHANV
jgi:hypothetical protein